MLPAVSRWLRRLAVLALALVAAGGVGYLVLDRPRPGGREAPEAEAMARALHEWLGGDAAWAATGALSWRRGSRGHLWDRRRGLARVDWDGRRVWLRLGDRSGVAERKGRRLEGVELEAALEKGYWMHINDAFWLHPFASMFDPGVRRAVVDGPSGPELLIAYASGGTNPGDAYQWRISADGTPEAWRMWVSILPIGGLEARWSGWTRLPTGLRLSTTQDLGPVHLTVEDLRVGEAMAALEPGADPFAVLLDAPAGGAPSARPSSRPAEAHTETSTAASRPAAAPDGG
jgi:hypothetical protein